MNTNSDYIDTRSAAAFVSMGESTLEKLRLTGGGPSYCKVGRRVLYEVADLRAWLAASKRRSTSDHALEAA